MLSHSVRGGLLSAASQVLEAAGQDAIVVGALPFDPQSPARLVLPEEIRRLDRLPVSGRGIARSAGAHWRVTATPTRAGYEEAVGRALAVLSTSGSPCVSKVVLARILELAAPHPIDPLDVLTRLLADSSATVFCVPLVPRVAGKVRALVGASPELLVERRRTTVTSLPMAGSAPRRRDAAIDGETARALASSAKDQREHRVVVDHVLDILAPHCRDISAPKFPVLASTATMWHLATPIEGKLKRDISSLELAAALHPTPAVCGSPSDGAAALIAQLEPFDRGYFTGTVGWCDGHGDGHWMVTVRCAEIEDSTARLYAGAGIVVGSDPEAEAAETSTKFLTLLRALDIDEEGRPLPTGERR